MKRYGLFYCQYSITLGFLCVLLYLYGFFPIKKSSNVFSSEHDLPSSLQDIKLDAEKLYNGSVTKTVLMVIDGLRVDFVTPGNMPYTTGVVGGGGGCQATARVAAPTVTLPRIKAIMTGSVSGFIDVVLNLGTAELTADNIIRQFTRTRKAVFYGDDTWIKLFPKQFERSDGTSSFFVNDYTEVDNNVTRHLDRELERSDWDLMILHYLGVDHIGHIGGPKSSLIQPKLLEMDGIIKRLHTYLMEQPGGVLVVCGDHGMKDSGSHGGVSLPEVLVPVVVLGLPCIAQPTTEIFQVDLAATLSALWGSPIPADNIGAATPAMLAHLSPSERLYAQLHNAQQLSGNFLRNGGHTAHEGYKKFEEAKALHYKWLMNNSTISQKKKWKEVEMLYQKSLIKMSRFLSEVLANYNMPLLCSSIIILLQVLFVLGLKLIGDRSVIQYQDLSTLLVATTVAGLFCVILLPPASQLVLVISGLFFIFNSLVIYRQLLNAPDLFKSLSVTQSAQSWNEIITPVGVVLFCISLFSSSLIEEEHQLWYFLWTTVMVLRLLECPSRWFPVLATHRFLRQLNSTGDKWAHLPDISDWLVQPDRRPLLSAMCGASLLCTVFCCTKIHSSRLLFLLYIWVAFFIYQHKAAVHQLASLLPSWETNGVVEARLCWWLLLAVLLLGRSLPGLLVCWSLAVCLLLRPYNTVLVPAMFLATRAASGSGTVLSLWIGSVFYFYQGNSNSLASVDLAAGFVGLEGYNVLPVGAQLLAHTFAMPVQAYLLHLHAIVTNNRKWESKVAASAELVVFLQLLHVFVCLVVITLQRYHLFVWTVFSPKLLYVAAQTLVCFILVSITNVYIYYANSRRDLFDV